MEPCGFEESNCVMDKPEEIINATRYKCGEA